MSQLIPFFTNEQPDSFGRYFNDILQQDDAWLEYTHNYIQWIFPNVEKSGEYPKAPTITPEVIAAFNHNPELLTQLHKALVRILAFYGLCINGHEITKTDNWDKRKTQWFTRRNHNALRITRILKCLMTLGMQEEAIRLYNTLVHLAETEPVCSISQQSFLYWHDAVSQE